MVDMTLILARKKDTNGRHDMLILARKENTHGRYDTNITNKREYKYWTSPNTRQDAIMLDILLDGC